MSLSEGTTATQTEDCTNKTQAHLGKYGRTRVSLPTGACSRGPETQIQESISNDQNTSGIKMCFAMWHSTNFEVITKTIRIEMCGAKHIEIMKRTSMNYCVASVAVPQTGNE